MNAITPVATRELMLAELRVEATRLRLAVAEVDAIGSMLSHHVIDPETARSMFNELWGRWDEAVAC